jgi:NAD(P)H-quinone oxidoreductase subunit H
MTTIETRTEPMVLNMGPHHPSMHGVLRLMVTLDGENVIDCEPVIGYLHRGMEKIAENRTNIMFVPYVSRWDYAAGMFNEAVTVNAPEKLANIQVPKRASYIRVIMLELNRIANHLLWLGPFLADVGAQTPFFYIFRERELIYDLFEAATGMRFINNSTNALSPTTPFSANALKALAPSPATKPSTGVYLAQCFVPPA